MEAMNSVRIATIAAKPVTQPTHKPTVLLAIRLTSERYLAPNASAIVGTLMMELWLVKLAPISAQLVKAFQQIVLPVREVADVRLPTATAPRESSMMESTPIVRPVTIPA